MSFADSNRVSLYHSFETVWGETPATPTMNEITFTSITGGHKKETVVPTTIRSDRMQESLVRVGENAEFSFNFELRHTMYDNLLLGLMCQAAYNVATITANTDISVDTSDNSFNRTTGSFISDGVVAGMWIKTTGFASANNNGTFRVFSVVALKVVVNAPTPDLVTVAAGPAITVQGKMVRNGVTPRSFCLEQRFNDITQYSPFTGMRPNQMDLTLNSRALITGSMSFMGEQGVPAGSSVAGSSVAAASNVGMDTSNNVISLIENDVVLTTPVLNAALTLNNNAAIQPAIANRFPIGVRYGVFEATGRIEVYFENLTLLNKFINHTATSLVMKLNDDNGKQMILTVPRLQFSEGDLNVSGQNTDILINLPFRSSFSSGYSNVFQLDVLT